MAFIIPFLYPPSGSLIEQKMSDSRIHNKPLVAVIGRPNVGISTLFNRFISERKAIVEDVPGVTRDRIYADTQWDGREFSLVDTGEIGRASCRERV